MEISNSLMNVIIIIHCWLNILALILGACRSDAVRISKDISTFIRFNKWYVVLGVVVLIFTMSPLTIPYSIKHIFNRLKDD